MTAQQLILDLLPLLVPYAVAHAFGVAVYLYHQVIQRLPANRRAILESIASKAVLVAEQKYKGMSGQQKHMMAETAIRTLCEHLEIPVPCHEVIDTLIEAAVASMNKEAARS